MTAVKICCIASRAEAEMAIATGADAIGLVGEMPSGPGPIPDALIADIASAVRGRILSVLLTSETTPEGVCAHVARCGTAAVQLVDAVDPATFPALRQRFPDLVVIQVIHVTGPEAVDSARAAAGIADMLLLDSGAPQNAVKELGGTGRVHDWQISAQITRDNPVPVWLAGGLNPGNAEEAIAAVHPYGLDICSGLRPHNHLDQGRLDAFMAATR